MRLPEPYCPFQGKRVHRKPQSIHTATPQKSVQLGEFGRVSTSWFADAAFLGDSLTAGFCANEYNIDVGGALICGYRSISPNTIVNRTTVTSPDRGEEVALDVLAANQPAKLYLLLGTNALVQTGNEDSFINYYARMLDELRAALAAGVDSIEHGAYLSPETRSQLAESHAVWVPTLVTIGNLIGCGRFPDEVLRPLLSGAMENVRLAASLGARIAPGSDAGAYRVLHGQGMLDEYALLRQAIGENADAVLERGVCAIREKF